MTSYGESFESFYKGEYSSLSPDYGNFVGYKMNASQLGFPGSPQTGNQLGEAVNAIKQGVKAFEVSMLTPDAAETIPKQHFKEMRALMKLTGVKPSVHGPLLDPSGFTERGWGGELAREDNERRMFDAIEKAKELEPNGNVPIVFHAAQGIPGDEYVPGDEEKGEKRFKIDKAIAINPESGKIVDLKREFLYRPGHPESLETGGQEFTPEERLGNVNATEWENQLTDLATFSKHADEIIGASPQPLKKGGYENALVVKDKDGALRFIDGKTHEELPPMNELELQSYGRLRDADIFLENVRLKLGSAFHDAYKYGSHEQKEELKELAEDYSKKMREISFEGAEEHQVFNPIFKQEILNEAISKLKHITKGRSIGVNGDRILDERYGAPKVYQNLNDFSINRASETFGNLAIRSYDKFGGNAPVIAVENMMQGMAFSRAEDIKKLVNKSRDRFVDYLVEKEGMSESEAEKIAEKQLGVTWDVGHLNLMRKRGFTEEDIVKQTEKIGKMVKHVHLTDNFGYGDSHLAPGMGNVPFKKILEALEKKGDLKSMRKIVEAGGVVAHFKRSPHPWTLSAFGSPIYGAKMAPMWNQAWETQGSYFGGYGTLNPEGHHNLYGAGFTTLPTELGGQIAGGRSRFGGTPMA